MISEGCEGDIFDISGRSDNIFVNGMPLEALMDDRNKLIRFSIYAARLAIAAKPILSIRKAFTESTKLYEREKQKVMEKESEIMDLNQQHKLDLRNKELEMESRFNDEMEEYYSKTSQNFQEEYRKKQEELSEMYHKLEKRTEEEIASLQVRLYESEEQMKKSSKLIKKFRNYGQRVRKENYRLNRSLKHSRTTVEVVKEENKKLRQELGQFKKLYLKHGPKRNFNYDDIDLESVPIDCLKKNKKRRRNSEEMMMLPRIKKKSRKRRNTVSGMKKWKKRVVKKRKCKSLGQLKNKKKEVVVDITEKLPMISTSPRSFDTLLLVNE